MKGSVMDRLKKIFAVLIAATLIVTSVGCSGNQESLTASASSSLNSESIVTSSYDSSSVADDITSREDTSSVVESIDTSSSVPNESGSTDDGTSEETSSVPEATSSAIQTTTSQPTENTAPPAEVDPPAAGITVSYNSANSWEESGKQCTQLDLVVKNTSSSGISGWTVEIDFGQAVEVMQCWNANAQGSGNKLTASNVEYNGEIASGAETSFGCIVKTSSKAVPKSVTVNGSSASVSGNTGNSNNDPGNNNSGGGSDSQPSVPPSTGEIEVTGRYGLVSDCGQLSVKGADLVDKNGEPVQLRGVSTHGIQWFPAFANKSAFKHLRDEWNINVIRLAMYTGAGEGYTDSTKAGIEQTVQKAVDVAIELDMYVIIDWHLLQDQSPQVRKADALRFFDHMSSKYASYPNVIYEICNEPNGYASWDGEVKPYAEEVIPVIRKNDPDSVIIVGTPTWSQDIDKAMANPLKYDNIMYALHYYASTHTDWLRDRLKKCYTGGLPIMVTEFGNCESTGNGYNDWGQAKKWLELMDSLNISYVNWSLCDKPESASLLKPGASSTGGWTENDLTENGKFMKDWFKNHP